MNINTINLKLVIVSLLSLGAFAVVGLVTTNTRASAVVDTCTWTGGGTGTEDVGAMTWTFNVNDAANWSCSIDGAAVPEAGDTLEFPANLAEVDPGDTVDDNDEWQWRYIVDNDLAADTEIAGVSFTGNPTSRDDSRYYITGNAIELSGDVTNEYTDSDYIMRDGGLFVDGITVTTDVTIETKIGGWIGSVEYADVSIAYGANFLTLSGSVEASDFIGTGDVIFTGSSNPSVRVGSHGGTDPVSNFIIDDDSTATIDVTGLIVQKIASLTVRDGGQLYLSGNLGESQPHNLEFPVDVTFEGTGRALVSGGGRSSGGGESSFTVVSEDRQEYSTSPRLGVYLYGASIGTYPRSYNKPVSLEFSGDITFTESDLTINSENDLNFSGALSGEGNSIDPRDSVGIVRVTSTDNDTDSEGVLNKRKIYKRTYSGVFNETYAVTASSGTEIVLDDIDLQDVVVQPFGRLSGNGGTAELFVAPDGVVAPGESPGCIETDGDLTLNGTYEFEIDTNTACTGYDQLDVTGAVDVTGATLELSLLDGYNFEEDDEFVLISNDGADEVTGEFAGLAEGAEIEEDGNTFVLSYEGGDGNDVSVLATAISDSNASVAEEDAPGAPDTGVGSLIQNPFVTITAATLAGVTIVGLRKLNSSK